MRRSPFVVLAAVTATLLFSATASAAWLAQGSGAGSSRARTMPAGNTPSATVTGNRVDVSWTASVLSGAGPVESYTITRYADLAATPNGSFPCAGGAGTLTCEDATVTTGSWRYTVTPRQGGWSGAESSRSNLVSVDRTAPSLVSLTSGDVDLDGKVDRVVAHFDDNLDSNYTAGNTPWTLSGQPTGVTLASVSVSGADATLTLNEGAAVDTLHTGFKVALAATAGGIRDSVGNQSSFAATTVGDGVAPVLSTLEMFDTTPANRDGKIDQVKATFSENLGTCTAPCTTGWTLTSPPSGGSLTGMTTSGTVATLTIGGHTLAADTRASAFTVALATSSGIVDASGNHASFATNAPGDKASPIITNVQTTTAGTVAGQMQVNDVLSVTFSEALLNTSVPTGTTISMVDPSGSGNDTLSITGLTNGALDTGSNLYVDPNNRTASFTGSSLTLASGNTVVQAKVLGACGPSGQNACGAGDLDPGQGALVFVPATSITDTSSNPATGTFTTAATFRIF